MVADLILLIILIVTLFIPWYTVIQHPVLSAGILHLVLLLPVGVLLPYLICLSNCLCIRVCCVTSVAKGLEVRRENPFPTSSERGALEAAAAAQKALVAGKRGLIIDIEV